MKFLKIFLIVVIFGGIPFVCAIEQRWGLLAVTNYWAVDSGKHMDWSGSTIYSSQWNIGVNVWNNYKSGVIRKDAWNTINDLTIEDVNFIKPKVAGLTEFIGNGGKSDATIYFSTTVMNQATDMQKKIACTHEIGHALGLDENNDLGTHLIMYNDLATNTSNNVLNSNDKANYDYMYNNKY